MSDKRTLSEAAFLEISPRHLFRCAQCKHAADMAMITRHTRNAELEVEVYCHGDVEKNTYQDRAGYEFPLPVFEERRKADV